MAPIPKIPEIKGGKWLPLVHTSCLSAFHGSKSWPAQLSSRAYMSTWASKIQGLFAWGHFGLTEYIHIISYQYKVSQACWNHINPCWYFQTCIPSCHSLVPGIWCGMHLYHSAFEKEVFDWACHWWTATPESTHPWGDQPPRFLWPSPLHVSDCILSNSPRVLCCIRHLCTCPWYKWWSNSLRSPPVKQETQTKTCQETLLLDLSGYFCVRWWK